MSKEEIKNLKDLIEKANDSSFDLVSNGIFDWFDFLMDEDKKWRDEHFAEIWKQNTNENREARKESHEIVKAIDFSSLTDYSVCFNINSELKIMLNKLFKSKLEFASGIEKHFERINDVLNYLSQFGTGLTAKNCASLDENLELIEKITYKLSEIEKILNEINFKYSLSISTRVINLLSDSIVFLKKNLENRISWYLFEKTNLFTDMDFFVNGILSQISSINDVLKKISSEYGLINFDWEKINSKIILEPSIKYHVRRIKSSVYLLVINCPNANILFHTLERRWLVISDGIMDRLDKIIVKKEINNV